ncbi:unnamed protein product [Bursaphelenchus xylophilus]|uniref:(pine wood nematode) hypothetical protein n=1 Tax=Bursaphelenchus xylophilus TaxID=6326 RepID=A0A1I7S709_BURXY|nr:unnamed protein product [Bursaphelenchus xylophilus]CAG9079459.1 unnamed protein product [Bursaphelenchus xylophilus]
MYKVFKSYSKKSERKQNETGKPPIHHSESSFYQTNGGGGIVHRSSSAQRLEGGPFITSPPPSVRNGVHGSQSTLRRTASKDRSDYQQGTYSSEYRSQQNGHQSRHQAHHGSTSSLKNGGSRFYDSALSYGAEGHAGALAERRGSCGGAHSLQRHTQTRSSHRQGFSESSSYETNEHFERKVERVKRTRGERSRSRSKAANGSSEYESRERMAIKVILEALWLFFVI